MSCVPLRILTENVLTEAIVTSVPGAVSSLPNANLFSTRNPEIARYLATSVTLTITLTVAKRIGCVVIPIHNVSITGTLRVITSAQGVEQKNSGLLRAGHFVDACDYDPCSDPCPDPTARSDADSSLVAWFDDHYADEITVEISDPNNQDGYIDLHYLMAGVPYRFQRRHGKGSVITYINNTKHTESLGGSTIVRKSLGNKRRISLPLDYILGADRSTLSAIYSHDNGTPLYISAFPEISDDRKAEFSILGTLISNKSTTSNSAGWTSKLEVLELWPLLRR